MTMPAGTYYVGDLCYVLQEEGSDIWGQLCKASNFEDGEVQLESGVRAAVYGTKYGDGSFFDKEGHEFAVDSGTLGCVLLEQTESEAVKKCLAANICRVVEFEEAFETSEEGGIVKLGRVWIDTGSEPDDNELE